MRNLTASDRAALIRLASTLPVGDENRRAILAGLTREASGASDPDIVTAMEAAGYEASRLVLRGDPHKALMLMQAIDRRRGEMDAERMGQEGVAKATARLDFALGVLRQYVRKEKITERVPPDMRGYSMGDFTRTPKEAVAYALEHFSAGI